MAARVPFRKTSNLEEIKRAEEDNPRPAPELVALRNIYVYCPKKGTPRRPKDVNVQRYCLDNCPFFRGFNPTTGGVKCAYPDGRRVTGAQNGRNGANPRGPRETPDPTA